MKLLLPFIIHCFIINCRQAEEALDKLIKFQHMETRQVIQDQLTTKFDVVMEQFMNEINVVEDIFMVRKVPRDLKLIIKLYF